MNKGTESRKDKKGRVLYRGESQRSDGRYVFRWKDENNKYQSVYSFRLTPKDRTPAGKKHGPSLRELEAEIDEIARQRKQTMTVLELVEMYVAGNNGVKNTTKGGYRTVVNFLKKNPLGSRRIDDITLPEAKEWLVGLQTDGMGYSSICTRRGVIRPAFEFAVEAGMLERNPFNFELAKCLINDSVTRDAYTLAQVRTFLKFVKKDDRFKSWYNGYVILFGTGVRIAELCAITMKDVDLKKKVLRINKQLLRANGRTYIQKGAKTKAGERLLPLKKEVVRAFRDEMAKPRPPEEPEIDGVSGFVFLNQFRKAPTFETNWDHNCKRAVEKYNSIYKNELPNLTPHICRHTYCTLMATTGVSLQTLQKLMGHESIEITLKYYTHLNLDQTKEDLANNGIV